jgi:hypothetical protein
MITKTELKKELRDLYNFLLEYNAVNAYIAAVESDEDNFNSHAIRELGYRNWIRQIFVYSGTNEGAAYWFDLQKKWLKYLETLACLKGCL